MSTANVLRLSFCVALIAGFTLCRQEDWPRHPRSPSTRLPWTAFFISWAITASAWLVANNIAIKESARPDV